MSGDPTWFDPTNPNGDFTCPNPECDDILLSTGTPGKPDSRSWCGGGCGWRSDAEQAPAERED